MSDEAKNNCSGSDPVPYGLSSFHALRSLERSLANLQSFHGASHMAFAGIATLYEEIGKAEDIFRGNHMLRVMEEQLRIPDSIAASLQSTTALPRFLEEERRMSERIAASFRLANEELTGISRSFAGIGDLSNTIQQIYRPEEGILPRISEQMEQFRAGGAIAARISQAMRVSIAAEAAFARFHGTSIGDLVGARPEITLDISSKVVAASAAYAGLTGRLCAERSTISDLFPVVLDHPPVEMFHMVDLAQAVTRVEPEPEIEQCQKDIRQGAAESVQGVLESTLARVNPNLRGLLDGAKLALHSPNPDRCRHVATSLRELMTHVLHTLSPDDDVKSWNSDPSHYQNNQPTRRARLLYICRRINHSQFTNFVKRDVDALLAFIDLFQQGTHDLTPSFTEDQMEAMVHRTEAAVLFLVNTALST